MAAGSHVEFCVFNIRLSAFVGFSLVYKFGILWVYVFGYIGILRCLCFALKLPVNMACTVYYGMETIHIFDSWGSIFLFNIQLSNA